MTFRLDWQHSCVVLIKKKMKLETNAVLLTTIKNVQSVLT
jgi:hypothetical protein